MNLITIILIGLALSMDACVVSLCCGITSKKEKLLKALKLGFLFGGFQAIMPLLGWLIGSIFEKYIRDYSYWLAFILLAFIGGRMIYESFKNPDCRTSINFDKLSVLLLLAVATSIDALAVGFSFAVLKINIFIAILIIGLITFVISFASVNIGSRFSKILGNRAELFGGLVLIAIGIKILIEHLYFSQ
ncbi:MAG: manganese efflux pump MntP family protein [Bacteroidales bacterium]